METAENKQEQAESLLEAIRSVPAARHRVFGMPALVRFDSNGTFQIRLKQKYVPEGTLKKLNIEYNAAIRPARDAGTWIAAMDEEAALRLALDKGLD